MITVFKPPHNRYALNHLDNSQYRNYANKYRIAKLAGIQNVQAWATGAGVGTILVDASKGVLNGSKRKIGAVIIGTCIYIATPTVVFVTNSTKVLKAAKFCHITVAYVKESADDVSNLCWLPLDMALFGQPIPLGEPDRWDLM